MVIGLKLPTMARMLVYYVYYGIMSLLFGRINGFMNPPQRAFKLLIQRKSNIAWATPNQQDFVDDAEDRMAKSMESLTQSLGSIQAGRPQPSMLDRICIEYFSVTTPIKNIANINVVGSSLITIEPHDKKTISAIEKAILESNLDLTPNIADETIRLNLPPMTEDRRKSFVKSVKTFGEEAKVSGRNIRRDVMDKLKKQAKSKQNPMSKDAEKTIAEAIQKVTDKYTKKIDSAVDRKAKDILKL